MQEGGEQNPYVWNFDLCSVTLGNFKYRKMSLVRDYETLLDNPPAEPGVRGHVLPGAAGRPNASCRPPCRWTNAITSCLPTPRRHRRSRRPGPARSYIIQGPPGTGKSQTITNLIADYVARGKRVLFVCEKRAAIDVVYARLRQCGLGDLCCLIHDSQTDKKGFVMDLKQTYEGLLGARTRPAPAAQRRRKARGRTCWTGSRMSFGRWSSSTRQCRASPPHVGIPLRQLLRRGIELRGELPGTFALGARAPARLCHAGGGIASGSPRWRRSSRTSAATASWPSTRCGDLSPRLAQVDRPLELIAGVLQAAEKHFEAVEASLGRCGVPREAVANACRRPVAGGLCQAGLAGRARSGEWTCWTPLARRPGSLPRPRQRFRRQQAALAEARQATAAWRQKLPAAEVPVAIEQAKAFEQSFFAWLRPAWWRLRRILNESYDFRSHVVRPRWSQVLAALQKEYEELDKLDRQRKAIAEQFRLDGDVDGLIAHVQQLRKTIPGLAPWLGRIHAALVKAAKAPQIVAKIVEADEPLRSLAAELDKIMHQHADMSARSTPSRVEAGAGGLG